MAELYRVRGLLDRTSPEFRAELRAVADRLGIDPTDLAAVISFETAGTFSPSIRNPFSGATGLIQWMPATARAFGTSTDALAKMSAVEQLAWVERYFARYRGRALTTHELYMVVFWGSPVGPETVLGVKDDPSRSGAVYRQNSALDQNHDGRILAGEASVGVRQLAAAARRWPPVQDPFCLVPVVSSGPPLAPSPGGSHIVRAGETLWLIAMRYTSKGARWPELRLHNDHLLASTTIHPGQVLILPPDWRQPKEDKR